MNTIFKYAIGPGLSHLYCGEILHFGEQYGQFFVWALASPLKNRTVTMLPTGLTFDDADKRHLGTVITALGGLVVHAFIDIDKPN